MPVSSDPFAAPISKNRPLLGVTILLVEDSRFCSEAVRLMSIRCGARLRRADCIKSAHKHLAIYRPDLIIVDLGLPDGSGLDLIRELTGYSADCPPVLAISGDVGDHNRQSAIKAGAVGFLVKPIGNINHYRDMVSTAILGDSPVSGFSPKVVENNPELDGAALFEDLNHVHDILQDALPTADKGKLQYCAQFVSSIAQTAHDAELSTGASQFFQRINKGGSGQRSGECMLALLKKRLSAQKTPNEISKSVA